MKSRHILSLFCLIFALAFTPASIRGQGNANYVLSETQLSSIASRKIKEYIFFDGLGRETLKATNGISSNGKFTYSYREITGEQMVTRNWLPVTGNLAVANLGIDAIIQMSSAQYYDNYAFEDSEYDAAGRLKRQHKAGQAWKTAPVMASYVTNVENDVIKYSVTSPEDPVLDYDGYYNTGTLSGECVVNEDGVAVTTFTDAFGRKILERRGTGNDTYFVYDNFGRLTFVLLSDYPNTMDLDTDAYQYRYDLNGNMLMKKLPGCAPIEYIYDPDDHCISVQDGELRKKGLYRFSLYDCLGRLAVQGLSSTKPDKNCRGTVIYECGADDIENTDYRMPEGFHLKTPLGSVVLPPILDEPELYCNSLNITIEAVEIVNYYDKYSFLDGASGNAFLNMALADTANAKGMQTGSIVLASNGERIAGIYSYDQKGNMVESLTKGLCGSTERTENTYTYTDKVATSEATVYCAGADSVVFHANNTYKPNNDFLASVTYQARVGTRQTDNCNITYTYDQLGRTTGINRPVSGGNGSIAYAYDMHGWIKDITSNTFSEHLHYADGTGMPLYSGNISSLTWAYGTDPDKGYMFSYDGMSRLVNAEYGENGFSTALGNYNERAGYDGYGNITSLVRNGLMQNGNYGAIDSLAIDYEGTQMLSVTEKAAPVMYEKSMDVKGSSDEIQYNTNGAIVADGTRGITNIAYDDCGNPRRIQFSNGSATRYVYSATGEKLRTVHYTAPANIHVSMGDDYDIEHSFLAADSTDYLLGGSVVFTNNRFSKILFDGGYISNDGYVNTYNARPNDFLWPEEEDSLDMAKENPFDVVDDEELVFRFYVKDHLGNNRMVIDSEGNVLQRTDYYPYGTPFYEPSTVNNSALQQYKYNGKELDVMHGLNTYDYGARQYYSVLPIWDRPDPLAEDCYPYSPYMYCLGNPMNAIDPDGKKPKTWKRVWGALQMIGGAAEMVGSGVGEYFSGGTASPMAIPIFLNGVDNFQAGFQQMVTGEDQETFLHKGVESATTSLGVDEGTSMAIIVAIDLSSGNFKSPQKIERAVSCANSLLRSGKNFSVASKYGIGSFNSLKGKVGKGTGLQIHHLIEQRFARLFNVKEGDMLSIVLTKEEHQAFTRAWRSKIGYKNDRNAITTINATPEDVKKAAKDIYRNYPEILKALGL